MHQPPKKKKAALVTKAAFKNCPDTAPTVQGSTASAIQEHRMNLTRYTPTKPSPLALIACINRG